MLQSSKQKFLSFQEKAVTFATETALMINNQIIYCRYENLFSNLENIMNLVVHNL